MVSAMFATTSASSSNLTGYGAASGTSTLASGFGGGATGSAVDCDDPIVYFLS